MVTTTTTAAATRASMLPIERYNVTLPSLLENYFYGFARRKVDIDASLAQW